MTRWVLTLSLAAAGCGGAVATDASPADSGGADSTMPDASVDSGEREDTAVADTAVSCPPPPSCNAPPPDPGPVEDWRHSIQTPITTAQGSERHRGRDLVLRTTDPQWAIAKFAYGLADKDLEDEDVDIFLLRDCGTSWELLGTATTTEDSTSHPTIERVEDDGGRVFFPIPAAATLGVGRHRIHFVVRGDHSTADQYIQVVDGSERFVVSDVDGTLTDGELAEFLTLLTGPSPAVNPGAPAVLRALSDRGYTILYLSARPDWLTARTHEWTRERGLPDGLVHVTLRQHRRDGLCGRRVQNRRARRAVRAPGSPSRLRVWKQGHRRPGLRSRGDRRPLPVHARSGRRRRRRGVRRLPRSRQRLRGAPTDLRALTQDTPRFSQ